jgi:hypothetical protein
VIDGELLALDASGRPAFNTLQNQGSGSAPVFSITSFDVLVLAGKDLTGEPFDVRRDLLQTKVLPKLRDPIRHSAALQGIFTTFLKPSAHMILKASSPNVATVFTRRVSVPARGGRCGSIKGRNSSSADTRRARAASMR